MKHAQVAVLELDAVMTHEPPLNMHAAYSGVEPCTCAKQSGVVYDAASTTEHVVVDIVHEPAYCPAAFCWSFLDVIVVGVVMPLVPVSSPAEVQVP